MSAPIDLTHRTRGICSYIHGDKWGFVFFSIIVMVSQAIILGAREDLAIGVPVSKWQEEKSSRHQLTRLLDFQVGS